MEKYIKLWVIAMFVPVFISGCSRSGTTLLGDMLGSHQRCLVTPESQFFLQAHLKSRQSAKKPGVGDVLKLITSNYRFGNWGIANYVYEEIPEGVGQFNELVEAIVTIYGKHNDKPVFDYWIDHTPMTIKYVATLSGLFSQAKFIHLVRDGRAVAASLLDVDWGGGTMNEFASLWMNKVGYGLAAESYLGSKMIRVRFEDLVCQPVATLNRICDFLGIDYCDSMLEGKGLKVPEYTKKNHALVGCRPQPERVTAWENKLTPRQIEIFERKCCDYLKCLGYEPQFGVCARPLRISERIHLFLFSRMSRMSAAIRRKKRIGLIDT